LYKSNYMLSIPMINNKTTNKRYKIFVSVTCLNNK
jgi:hypothetical protein